MKLKLFYVVRPVEFGGDEVQLIAGPFQDWGDANEVIDKIIGRHDYYVVSQVVEVRTA